MDIKFDHILEFECMLINTVVVIIMKVLLNNGEFNTIYRTNIAYIQNSRLHGFLNFPYIFRCVYMVKQQKWMNSIMVSVSTHIVHVSGIFLHQFVSSGKAYARHGRQIIAARQDAHVSKLIQRKILQIHTILFSILWITDACVIYCKLAILHSTKIVWVYHKPSTNFIHFEQYLHV